MASRVGPRSASDATRFTSTTPHAASKHSPTSSAASSRPPAAAVAAPSPRGMGKVPGETPEERVRRLRAAHEAARKAQTSNVDRVIGGSRRLFDVAHKATVVGLVGFTAIAGLVSLYSVYDMVTYNKQRRADFIEAQRKMEEDSLAAARLAFINGTASDAQVALVEEAQTRARETGTKLPPLLSAPTVTTQAEKIFGTGQQQQQQQQQYGAQAVSPAFPTTSEAAAAAATTTAAEGERKQSSWWPFSKSEPTTSPTSVKDAAKAAFEQERENQRRGGALDQIGLPPQEKEKKGWW
ncbi:hypothetical protein Cob_v010295 [Colletotrichum orbiculare MAFF 240422]|uniref:Cytochrome oxidase c assembly domain-containing protein n=1 Tax=Colletotrichum orbiculare (strain 104-T / ATCC 96160 / CBS 514.97 / LARS 414 / MAFF 240422) TaxID=1213857 RepID=N4VQF3_COLOR|nr:hypothetical protein Cob_v010295 [Colletotrichum orbiculare MAFF 240422]